MSDTSTSATALQLARRFHRLLTPVQIGVLLLSCHEQGAWWPPATAEHAAANALTHFGFMRDCGAGVYETTWEGRLLLTKLRAELG